MKKTIFMLAAGLLTCSSIFSQERGDTEVGVNVHSGVSTISMSTNLGSTSSKAGVGMGVSFNYYLDANWSITAGFDLTTYASKFKVDLVDDFSPAFDGESDFEFRSKISNYEETQNLAYLGWTIAPRYEFELMGEHKMIVSAGLKFALPTHKKFNLKNIDMFNRGSYLPENPELEVESPTFQGFGHFSAKDHKGSIKANPSVNLTFDWGINWDITSYKVYTGVYCEYGLNSINKKKDTHLVNYNTEDPTDFNFSSVLNSKYSTRANGKESNTRLVKNSHLIGLGLKVGLFFSL